MAENEQKGVDESLTQLLKTRTESLAVIHAVQGESPAAALVIEYAELSDHALWDLAANVYKTKFKGSILTKETLNPWIEHFNRDKAKPIDPPGVQKVKFTFKELLRKHRMIPLVIFGPETLSLIID